jgi:DNA-binding NarL/FixJ family response regulator
MRVLVVEDSWHVAKALKFALEQMGMDVFGPAATTAAASRLAAEHIPSIAIVDCQSRRRGIVCSHRGALGSGHPRHRDFRPRDAASARERPQSSMQKPFSASELSAALQSGAASDPAMIMCYQRPISLRTGVMLRILKGASGGGLFAQSLEIDGEAGWL